MQTLSFSYQLSGPMKNPKLTPKHPQNLQEKVEEARSFTLTDSGPNSFKPALVLVIPLLAFSSLLVFNPIICYGKIQSPPCATLRVLRGVLATNLEARKESD